MHAEYSICFDRENRRLWYTSATRGGDWTWSVACLCLGAEGCLSVQFTDERSKKRKVLDIAKNCVATVTFEPGYEYRPPPPQAITRGKGVHGLVIVAVVFALIWLIKRRRSRLA